MSAALHTSAPARAPLPSVSGHSEKIGAGTRARRENDRWRNRNAAAEWLAQHRVQARSDVDLRRARKIELNNEKRVKYRSGRKCIGTDRQAGEIDVAARKASNPTTTLDFALFRDKHPDQWRRLFQYLQGCPAAQRIALLLAEGVPALDLHKHTGTSPRAVRGARRTLNNRIEKMRDGAPTPPGQPGRRRPTLTPMAEPADNLFAAQGLFAPVMPPPKRQKQKRQKLQKPMGQLDLFDLKKATDLDEAGRCR